MKEPKIIKIVYWSCKATEGMKSELTGNIFCVNGHLIKEGAE